MMMQYKCNIQNDKNARPAQIWEHTIVVARRLFDAHIDKYNKKTKYKWHTNKYKWKAITCGMKSGAQPICFLPNRQPLQMLTKRHYFFWQKITGTRTLWSIKLSYSFNKVKILSGVLQDIWDSTVLGLDFIHWHIKSLYNLLSQYEIKVAPYLVFYLAIQNPSLHDFGY